MSTKRITYVLLRLENTPEFLNADQLRHEVETSINFGNPKAEIVGSEVIPAPVDHKEWTDDEWLRIMSDFLPGTHVRQVEEAVGRWREEEANGPST